MDRVALLTLLLCLAASTASAQDCPAASAYADSLSVEAWTLERSSDDACFYRNGPGWTLLRRTSDSDTLWAMEAAGDWHVWTPDGEPAVLPDGDRSRHASPQAALVAAAYECVSGGYDLGRCADLYDAIQSDSLTN